MTQNKALLKIFSFHGCLPSALPFSFPSFLPPYLPTYRPTDRPTNKSEQGGSYHVCTFAFLTKNAEIFKIKFYSYSLVFPLIVMKIDFSARFYCGQLFVLFSALSIIFFAHFQQKWLLIHWL